MTFDLSNGLTLRHDTKAKRKTNLTSSEFKFLCDRGHHHDSEETKAKTIPQGRKKYLQIMSDNRLLRRSTNGQQAHEKGPQHREPPWKCNSKPQTPLHTH